MQNFDASDTQCVDCWLVGRGPNNRLTTVTFVRGVYSRHATHSQSQPPTSYRSCPFVYINCPSSSSDIIHQTSCNRSSTSRCSSLVSPSARFSRKKPSTSSTAKVRRSTPFPLTDRSSSSLVCIKTVNTFVESLGESDKTNPEKIEKAFKKYCGGVKVDTKEHRLCYYIGALETSATYAVADLSKPLAWGIPAEKICRERLFKSNPQICDLRYGEFPFGRATTFNFVV